ncbi:hypothetical protein EDB84DRAFT_1675912, partial [Lactarius hengduanensis]
MRLSCGRSDDTSRTSRPVRTVSERRREITQVARPNDQRIVFSPAKVIFAGASVLLLAAKEVEASQDILIDIFGRIENFFRRLEMYTKVSPTPAMTNMMVKIMVEVLDILGTATKEMKQSRAKKFLKKVAGIRRLEDGLKKLDKMTNEEARMANAEVLKVAHDINERMEEVEAGVRGV